MAGIGFVLRRLASQDNLSGTFRAFVHSSLASTGPWLFTVASLGLIVAIGSKFNSFDEIILFRVIIVYNFAFSLVFSGSVLMVATRFLADAIHRKDVTGAPGLLIGSFISVCILSLPVLIWFYFYHVNISVQLSMSAIVNFLVICAIWLSTIFMSALKDFKTVTRAFAIGISSSILISTSLAKLYDTNGMLNGFTLGLCIILAIMIARIFAEYPYRFKEPFAFLKYFKKYWQLALSGLVYNIAIWIDKWVLWFSPFGEITEHNFILYTNYDSAMFLAFLSIVPSMAIFVYSIETSFFEQYLKFYRDIQKKATYEKIQNNHKEIIQNILSNLRNFIIIQGCICALVIMIAPKFFEILGNNYSQIGIFRFGVIGAFFHVIIMFLSILLSYFDNRKETLIIQIIFLVTNGLFTYIFIDFGFAYLGFGYFLSTAVTFLYAAFRTAQYVNMLPYHTFITTNRSV